MGRGSASKGGRREERLRRKAERAAMLSSLSPDGAGEPSGNGQSADSAAPLPPVVASPRTRDSEFVQYGAIRLYKPGQGYWVRMGTAMGIGILALLLAHFLYTEFSRVAGGTTQLILQVAGPVAALFLGGWLVVKFCGTSRRSVDFLIATEGEMRKVNWSTRKEVTASTKVVLMVCVLLTVMLAIVDAVFHVLFYYLGVLRIPPLGIGG